MPVLRVNPNSNVRLPYGAPRQVTVSVRVEIETGRTADVLVLDHESLDAFDAERGHIPTCAHAKNTAFFRREVVVKRKPRSPARSRFLRRSGLVINVPKRSAALGNLEELMSVEIARFIAPQALSEVNAKYAEDIAGCKRQAESLQRPTDSSLHFHACSSAAHDIAERRIAKVVNDRLVVLGIGAGAAAVIAVAVAVRRRKK